MWKTSGYWPAHKGTVENMRHQTHRVVLMQGRHTKIQTGRQVDPVAIKSNIPPALLVWRESKTKVCFVRFTFQPSVLFGCLNIHRSLFYSCVLILASSYFVFAFLSFVCIPSFVPVMSAGVSGHSASTAR